MTLLESVVETTVCLLAKDSGWLVRKLKWIGRRNAMDRLFAKDGRVVFIEFKRPGKEPIAGQGKEIARFQEAGIECYAVDNIEQGCDILKL